MVMRRRIYDGWIGRKEGMTYLLPVRFAVCGTSWLEKEGDERVAVIRSKAYVGASRAILRSFKKNNWMGENRIETATREELRTCLSEHTKDLQMELGEKADDDRLGKLLAWLETPPMPPDTFNDYLDSDEEEDGGAEDGSEQGNTG